MRKMRLAAISLAALHVFTCRAGWDITDPDANDQFQKNSAIACAGNAATADSGYTVRLERDAGLRTVEGSKSGTSTSVPNWSLTLDPPQPSGEWTPTGSNDHFIVLRVAGETEDAAEVEIVIQD